MARLKKLQELAKQHTDLAAFTAAAMRIGWTQGDSRTREFGAPLERLLELVFRHETGDPDASLDAAIEASWLEFHRVRMERMIGCLSTPVPRPAD